MVRRKLDQRGVSLVEVVLTLAISALLLTAILSGRNSVRSTAQFSDGMERIKEMTLSTKSDANTGINTKGNGTGVSTSSGKRYLVLGRSIRFTKDSSKATVASILCYSDSKDVCTDQLQTTDSHDITLPWGITYTGSYSASDNSSSSFTVMTIVFERDQVDGSFKGWWNPTIVAPNSVYNGVNRNYFSQFTQHKTEVTLNFKSPDGRAATLVVNPVTGTVVRNIP